MASGQTVTPEGPGEEVEVTGVTAVPVVGPLNNYRLSQASILINAFCTTSSSITIFDLQSSAITEDDALGSSTTVGAVRWTTLHVSDYDLSQLDPSHPHFAALQAPTTHAALLIGRLEGTCGTVPCLAWGFDVLDANGNPKHILIPLVQISAQVEDIAEEVFGWFGPRQNSTNPCDSDTHCYDTYKQRLKDALDTFGACVKGGASPITLWNVGCFLGCVPLLTGTPLLYAACVAACNGVVSTPGVIDVNTCSNALTAEKASAKQSYCDCLTHKLQNCPDKAETDLVGCP
jgi:hypothetical protein